jgi:hypothetical protein
MASSIHALKGQERSRNIMNKRYGVVKVRQYERWTLLLVNLARWNGAGEVLFEDDSWFDAKLTYEWARHRMASGLPVERRHFV